MKYPTLRSLLEPHSDDRDVRRREFILNVLLLGLLIFSFLGLLAALINLLNGRFVNGRGSVVVVGAFFALIAALWRLSKAGHHSIANYSLLSLVGLLVVWLMLQWSFELPISELCYSFLLVMSGVLLSAKAALRFSAITLVLYLFTCYAQGAGWLDPKVNWLNQPIHFGDAIGDAIIFCIIILISWLANREVDRSLFRARSSELALVQERDSLELKVTERTRQLEETQNTRLLELQRFAEFGRLSANLLHEVSNPLTAASLKLEQLEAENHSQLGLQIHENVQRIERYITAARKQLTGQGEITKFTIRSEIEALAKALETATKKAHIEINIICAPNLYITGDVIKFSQLVRNLLTNSLEAYSDIKQSTKTKKLEVNVAKNGNTISLEVHDWGIGIKPAALAHVFDPFYSTKQSSHHNLGIGLSMVKKFVEEDFGGNISLTSSPAQGTCFHVTLKQKYVK
jgi:signal transduction histidine kinase